MGERNRRLINIIVDGKYNNNFIKRFYGLDDQQLTDFINRNSKQITFEKLKRNIT